MDIDRNAPVLITGGTGFVGQALVKRLIDAGHRVRVVTRSARGLLADNLRQSVSQADLLDFYEATSAILPAWNGPLRGFSVCVMAPP